jgi:hypothetical protein
VHGPQHAIKKVDRLATTHGIVVWDMFAPSVVGVVGERKTIFVAAGWIDFDAENRRRWP